LVGIKQSPKFWAVLVQTAPTHNQKGKTMYQAVIIEAPERNGTFIASCPGFQIISVDPEHDLCHAMAEAGVPDGPIQFYRDGMPTLSHPSVHRWGARQISMGKSYPWQTPKRQRMSAEARARLKLSKYSHAKGGR
jgi:hypothetical protein